MLLAINFFGTRNVLQPLNFLNGFCGCALVSVRGGLLLTLELYSHQVFVGFVVHE